MEDRGIPTKAGKPVLRTVHFVPRQSLSQSGGKIKLNANGPVIARFLVVWKIAFPFNDHTLFGPFFCRVSNERKVEHGIFVIVFSVAVGIVPIRIDQLNRLDPRPDTIALKDLKCLVTILLVEIVVKIEINRRRNWQLRGFIICSGLIREGCKLPVGRARSQSRPGNTR